MKWLALVAVAALALTLPLWAGGAYYINLASQVMIAALFAMSLNLLVGYAGLTSLGHAGYLGLSAYLSGWLMLRLGWDHGAAAVAALAGTTAMAALFGLVALRATGISFLMITLALGQILWGVAYRWADVTGGDNGLSGLTRPHPFGIDLGPPGRFYFFTLAVLALVGAAIAVWVRSPFGASIRATRDQPRRMSALGFDVWLIRWITFVVSGFLGAVAGLMYVYYHQFISPHSISLANSAEM
ncbi:MAG: branched-chain amino acid ABC transporter permease, partial [Caldimonas sp.]